MRETHDSFSARWAAVNRIQEHELRRLSPAERFVRLEQLFAFQGLMEDGKDTRDVSTVRRRWMKLRHRLRAGR